MKKVLHFIPNFKVGGIESLFFDTYKYIDKTKVNLNLLVESESSNSSIEYIQKMGCKVYVVKKPTITSLKQYYSFMYDLLKRENYDIVHSHSPHRSFLFFLAAKSNNIKTRILQAHTTRLADDYIKRIIYRLLLILGNQLSTMSLAVSDKAGDYFFKSRDYLVISNGIDTSKYAFDYNRSFSIKKELNLENKYTIGHIGRFSEPKNHKFLIDIFNEFNKDIPNSRLLLVGDGPIFDSVKKYASDKGIANAVIFYGRSNHPEELYQAMDYFVFPSIYEGFPLTLIEAQSAGLKILSSNNVPSQIQITELLDFMSLDSTPKQWSNLIIEHMHYHRTNNSKRMRLSEYDIRNSVKSIENIYLKSEC